MTESVAVNRAPGDPPSRTPSELAALANLDDLRKGPAQTTGTKSLRNSRSVRAVRRKSTTTPVPWASTSGAREEKMPFRRRRSWWPGQLCSAKAVG